VNDVIDPTKLPGASEFVPGSLPWRKVIARTAHLFFSSANPLAEEYGARIHKPPRQGLEAWSVNDFINFVMKSSLQPGDATLIPRLLTAMERAGLLIEFRWADGFEAFGRCYESQGRPTFAVEGDLWLCEALGPDLVVEAFNPVTVRISRKGTAGCGTGLVLSPIHVLTNRHVVEGLAGREVDIINITLAFDRIGATRVTHECRVWGHAGLDVAVIELKVGDQSIFPVLPGMVFGQPDWAEDVYIFGYPPVPGTKDEPITVQPGRIVNPRATAVATGGYPERNCFLFSAVTKPGNSGGPIVGRDGRVIGLVEESAQSGLAGSGSTQSIGQEEPTFYRGIPGDDVVGAIEELDSAFVGLTALGRHG